RKQWQSPSRHSTESSPARTKTIASCQRGSRWSSDSAGSRSTTRRRNMWRERSTRPARSIAGRVSDGSRRSRGSEAVKGGTSRRIQDKEFAMNATPSTEVHRWRAFAVLAVAFFMTVVDLTIVNVALPTIGRKLHFSESNLQWVITAYGLTFGGRAADLLGRRRILMLGLALFTGASLGAGLATSSGFLIAMRGLQGLGAAVVLPAALSIVMNMFTEGAERNKALVIWGGIGAAGATIGVITGGLVTRYVGWEYIFFLNVPIGLAAFVLAPRIVPESRLQDAKRRFDPLGAVTVTGSLLAVVYAISTAPQVGWGTTRTVGLLVGSAILLAGFLAIETRVEAPLMPLRIFRNRSVA